jgi:hypothetical protein
MREGMPFLGCDYLCAVAKVTGKKRPENGCSPRRYWLSDFEVTGKKPLFWGV